jgi:hypothetical protein
MGLVGPIGGQNLAFDERITVCYRSVRAVTVRMLAAVEKISPCRNLSFPGVTSRSLIGRSVGLSCTVVHLRYACSDEYPFVDDSTANQSKPTR